MLWRFAFGFWAWLLFLVPAALAEDGAWVRAETASFTLYCQCSANEATREARELQDFHMALTRVTGLQPRVRGAKLPIYYMRQRGDLARVWPEIPALAGGFYMARPEIIAAFAPLRLRDMSLDPREVLFHEYAHHFMLATARSYMPLWYVEGFAEFVMTAKFTDDEVQVGHFSKSRVDGLFAGQWIPTREVLTKPLADFNRDDRWRYYGQAWLMTHYLNNNAEARAAFPGFLAALGRGTEPVAAFEAAFKMSPETFHARLQAYLRGRLTYFRYPREARSESNDVTLTPLNTAADALLLLNARLLRSDPQAKDQADLLADVRQATDRFPDDRFARLVRARAEIYFGAPQTARTLLDAVLGANANDAEAHYLSGLLHYWEASRASPAKPEQWEAARQAFARANALSPDNYRVLYRYALATIAMTGAVAPDILAVLIRAAVLAPQVSEIGLRAGAELIRAGRTAEAKVLLQPIAANSHGGKAAEMARRALELIDKGDAGAAGFLSNLGDADVSDMTPGPDGEEPAAPDEAPPPPQ